MILSGPYRAPSVPRIVLNLIQGPPPVATQVKVTFDRPRSPAPLACLPAYGSSLSRRLLEKPPGHSP